MKTGFRFSLLAACLASLPTPANAQWQAVEKVETYAISGTTGLELYASIGERGPQIGGLTRAIAHTSFTLTWSRDYQRQASNACTLVSARPKLTITYTLPRPSRKLPAPVAGNWETFIAGVQAHEKVHGAFIEDMTRQIEAVTVGLSVENDPNCRKIRTELTNRLAGIAASHRQRNRDFDRAELSDGGNVHKLILMLVNGD